MTSALASLTLVLADDHAIVRMGFRLLLEGVGARVLAEADSGEKAQLLMTELDPDVLVMDLSMPGCGGLAALERILARKPGQKVLIASAHADAIIAERALKAGAAGYLTKQSAPELLVTAIRQVASGKKYVSPSLAEELANAIGDDSERPPHEKLSDREYQTLCMIASGKTPAEIAEALNLSVKTVSVYRARLLEKMNLRNNAELTHYGLKHGLAE